MAIRFKMTKAKVLSLTGVLLLLTVGCLTIVLAAPAAKTENPHNREYNSCSPVVIAHRGASGYIPEHTLGSYALAITIGSDFVEPDLVITKDGHLIARHDNELGLTTDVGNHPEFSDRYRTQRVDGKEISGWFTEDFTLKEIKTLRAIERIPDIRPGNARLDGIFEVPTFQEIIDLVKSMQSSQRRNIGIYPEIKHSTHFEQLGLKMEELVVNTFHENGYRGFEAPVYIQSFEVSNLKELRTLTDLKLLQLYESDVTLRPADQIARNTNLTYAKMLTPEGLKEVSKYANAVGPDKSLIIPRNNDNTLGEPTSFVADAHNAGLQVHPYTFRAENDFLPKEFKSDDSDSSRNARGNLKGEIEAFIAAGIDGLFTDNPDVPVILRGKCSNN
ncbi:uncharacterized protein LOC116769006 [Danaus plexippus]|nr:uncharacterized protein LOC116769006 [Danaus plexippus]